MKPSEPRAPFCPSCRPPRRMEPCQLTIIAEGDDDVTMLAKANAPDAGDREYVWTCRCGAAVEMAPAAAAFFQREQQAGLS